VDSFISYAASGPPTRRAHFASAPATRLRLLSTLGWTRAFFGTRVPSVAGQVGVAQIVGHDLNDIRPGGADQPSRLALAGNFSRQVVGNKIFTQTLRLPTSCRLP
jgi:hypothetical protein